MKENIIFLLLIVFSVVAILCFLIKLLLWLKLNRGNRIGFITSFFAFFSVHDVHNASSNDSKRFRRVNNKLNAFFWGSLFGLAIVFMFNTDDANGLVPTKGEKLKERYEGGERKGK